MKVVLVQPPTSRPKAETLPAGLLYVAGALLRAGHDVQLFDADLNRQPTPDAVDSLLGTNYNVAGFGGITTTYGWVKAISLELKRLNPGKPLIAGGFLSTVSGLLLERTGIDAVVTGEGEISSVNLVDALESGAPLASVRGIAFRDDGSVLTTEPEQQIGDLDVIPIPPYELLEVERYFEDIDTVPYFSLDTRVSGFIGRGLKAVPLFSGRGCTARCTFCYRHMKGYRQHSVDYVLDHMRYFIDRHGVRFFTMMDEHFTANRRWLTDFCTRVKELDIYFRIGGARVDSVNEGILRALHDAGCTGIDYGFESGSERMLKAMKKRTTVEQNVRAANLTYEARLHSVPQLVLGMPGEDRSTITETVRFLGRCGFRSPEISINFATAYPGTELFRHALRSGLVRDIESYVLSLGDASRLVLNFTQSSDLALKAWSLRVARVFRRSHFLRNRRYLAYLSTFVSGAGGLPWLLRRLPAALRRYGLRPALSLARERLEPRRT